MRKIAHCIILLSFFTNHAATVEGNVDPAKLLAWVDSQKTIPANLAVLANGKDMNHGGTGFCKQCSDANSQPTPQNKTISLYATSKAVFFEADMDIDCDGSNNGICSGTDPSHQNQLSCDILGKCSMDNSGPIDAAGTPFYVIPVDTPFSYKARGIAIGQIAAVINRKSNPVSIVYAPFLDEDGVNQEIGEASAAMAGLLGVPNNPNTGGQDTGLVYIIFRGAGGRLTTIADMADHQKAITLGQALAADLIGTPVVSNPERQVHRAADNGFRIDRNAIFIRSDGRYAVRVYNAAGECMMMKAGNGPQMISTRGIRAGVYVVNVDIGGTISALKTVREQ
jgi:Fungal chitosanase of glycosyl hydrolase group 75